MGIRRGGRQGKFGDIFAIFYDTNKHRRLTTKFAAAATAEARSGLSEILLTLLGFLLELSKELVGEAALLTLSSLLAGGLHEFLARQVVLENHLIILGARRFGFVLAEGVFN